MLFSTFLTIINWYLCDKYLKSNPNVRFSCQTFLDRLKTSARISDIAPSEGQRKQNVSKDPLQQEISVLNANLPLNSVPDSNSR